jgi:predicted transcriptional regulator
MQLSCNYVGSQGGGLNSMRERKDDRLSSLPLGSLQRASLETLWSSGQSSIRDVVERLDSELHSVPYNTVASALNALCAAGLATRVRIQGAREYLYSAQVSREQLEKAATTQAVRIIFERSRSPRSALAYLVDLVSECKRPSLNELGEMVEQRRREAKSKPGR